MRFGVPRMVCWTITVAALTDAPSLVVGGTGTSLSDRTMKYGVPGSGYVVLRRGPVEAIVVDNRAVDDGVLKGHRAGYSGVASLRHEKRGENLFVSAYAGLNFEHIHDGTVQPNAVLYEPRNAPMELRVIDEHTAELYQRATPHWGLESCQRYRLLEDGAIELTVECVPRKRAFANGYVGLFWASYIHQPEQGGIQFLGRPDDGAPRDGPGRRAPQWVAAVSPLAKSVAMSFQLPVMGLPTSVARDPTGAQRPATLSTPRAVPGGGPGKPVALS